MREDGEEKQTTPNDKFRESERDWNQFNSEQRGKARSFLEKGKKYWKGAANPRTQELEMEDLAKILGRDSEVGKERLLRIFANLNTDLQGGISFEELQDFIRGPKATTPGVGKKDN